MGRARADRGATLVARVIRSSQATRYDVMSEIDCARVLSE